MTAPMEGWKTVILTSDKQAGAYGAGRALASWIRSIIAVFTFSDRLFGGCVDLLTSAKVPLNFVNPLENESLHQQSQVQVVARTLE